MGVDEEDKAMFLERMTFHERFPNVSTDSYVKLRQVELGKSIADRKLVYLDTKFWILLRDVATGHKPDAALTKLLVKLAGLVEIGRVLCPMSDILYAEVIKQKNPDTRRATAQLIDDLSLGISIVNVERRMATELAHAIYHFGGMNNLHSLTELAWTKICHMLGPMHLNPDLFTSKEVALAVQKATVDILWPMTLSETVSIVGSDATPPEVDWEGAAARMNAGIQAHSHEVNDFKGLIATELRGAMSLHQELMADIFNALMNHKTGNNRPLTEEERVAAKTDIMRSMVICAAGDDGSKYFPTLHIGAMCHSYIRWDKRRAFKANDQLDIQHAAAALGYCDAFLTEKSLKTMLTAGNMNLDKLYECVVISDAGEAIRYLESI